ncbi:hypothetical protein CTAYLR_005785 [Chrysophaeum taylorii]|uniref:Uncharacterized protein n=1 Tax=Chrysophaeum taylorii TaxID=2483200 RepID=A0AAD7UNV3_9STRA|nr:hypothetical protein CTAYLR_005785 [Chrysophaeum taylorii]
MPQARENSTLVLGGLGVAATAVVAQYGLKAYREASASSNTFETVFARRFYDGPFEAKMTRREAALILGTVFLRKKPPLLRRFLAGKINEAKDILIKGKT